MVTQEALRVVTDGSGQLTTWAFALAAGSVAAIVSTGYLHPPKRWRLIYLLFLPAWLFLALSVHYGNQISRRHLAAVMGAKENIKEIAKAINADFACQQSSLSVSLILFALWLVLFLSWWIFLSRDKSP